MPTARECYTRLCARFPEFTVGGDSNVLIIGRKVEGKRRFIHYEETNNVSNPIRTADEREQYRDLIRENIEYDILAKNNPADRIRLDELVELMLDTVCSKRSSIRIAGDEFPTEVVKSRFLKLEAQHIQYVLDSLKDNPPHIHNIKKYLLAALYNAPLTIENYYAAQINHDLYGRNRGDVNGK